jgi:hypothetical protein
VGGVLRGWSNGAGFRVYIVPAALAPKRHTCRGGTAICEPTVKRPPGKPFVLVGRVPGKVGQYGKRPFSFRVPAVHIGLYRAFVYCRPCGRSLIQSGSRIEGETIRILSAATRRVTYPRDRLSVVLPSGWHVTSTRINGVLDPVTIFTATSFRLRHPRSSEGICSATLQQQWHVHGAYVQLAEERDGASRKRMLRRVPPRPRHFQTRREGAGGLCTPADSGQITFHERGRAFYIYYGIGRRASPETRIAVRALLDSLRIGRR